MKYTVEELKEFIKNVKNPYDDLSKEENINRILEMIERCITQYPEWVDEPGQDRYYSTQLILHKSQMLLVKEGLEILKSSMESEKYYG